MKPTKVILLPLGLIGLMLSTSGFAVNPDADGDGLSDDEEINIYGTNPENPDTDGDGLTDAEEILEYGTDALNEDTDADELLDAEEINTYGTDPLSEGH